MGNHFQSYRLSLVITIFCLLIESAYSLNCHVCSSDKLNDCATLHSGQELPSELCPADVASCYTNIQNGVTYRGCLAKDTLCGMDSGLCMACKSKNCNSQIFPEDRLSCLHCDGSSCVNQTNNIEVRYSCVNYDQEDQCYTVFSYEGSVAYRGCVSDSIESEGKDYCLRHIKQCSRCTGRACNVHKLEFEKTLSCVKCSPDENNNCNVIDNETNGTECAPTTVGYKDACYHHNIGGISTRGCLYEASNDIFNECSKDNSEKCATCTEPDCNRKPAVNENLYVNPLSSANSEPNGQSSRSSLRPSFAYRYCYKCDSSKDPNCVNNLVTGTTVVMTELCNLDGEEHLGCYHMITDSVVKRGCVINLKKAEQEKCLANDDTCKRCTGEQCNGKIHFLSCYTTDHSQTATTVFVTPSSSKICSKYDDSCFLKVVENGKVIRGCIQEHAAQNDLSVEAILNQQTDSAYQLCTTPLCNIILPSYCYACNSKSDGNCAEPREDSMTICPVETFFSGCFHYDNGSNIERGCVASLDDTYRTFCGQNTEYCKTCEGELCNNRKKFARCISRDSSLDGQLSYSKQCVKYDDACVLHIFNSAVLRRGCLSELATSITTFIDLASDCETSINCEKCDEVNCNDRVVEIDNCTVCSSINDPECLSNPTTEMTQICPLNLHRLGCYRKEVDEVVTRGCVFNLSPEERVQCTDKENNVCKPCIGNACNSKVQFQRCVECNSETDGVDCQIKPNSMPDKICNDYMANCFTHIGNGIVSRGCADDSIVSYASNDMENYSLCETDKCNALPIKNEVCISCDSNMDENCVFDSNSSWQEHLQRMTKECLPILSEKSCYHFVETATGRHVRGCVGNLHDQIKNEYLNRQNEYKTCKGPQCNSRVSLARCMSCTSTNNSDCAYNLIPSFSKVCSTYNSECFTLTTNYAITRGCLDDYDFNFRRDCWNDKSKCETCTTVEGLGCNDVSFETDICVKCDSDKDEYCRTNPEKHVNAFCNEISPTTQSGCYFSIDGDHVTKGCIRDLDKNKANECIANSVTCKSCNGPNCNLKKEFQVCYSCNSQNNPKCSSDPLSVKTEICRNFESQCITGTNRSGYTFRGCSSDYGDLTRWSENFELCAKNKCNDEDFPGDTLRCYQCSGQENCNLMSKERNLSPKLCAFNSKYDQCFTYINKDEKMFRGCLSDATEERLLCEGSNEDGLGSCVKCTTNGCNNQPKFIPPQLSCVKCSDWKECAYGQDASTATACVKDVLFGSKETCFVHSINGTSKVERNCTMDIESEDADWCQEDLGCETCVGSGCNIQNGRYNWCLRCNSDIKGDCGRVSEPNEFIEQCDVKPYSYDRRGCYTIVQGIS